MVLMSFLSKMLASRVRIMRRSISRTPLDPRRGQVDTGLPVDDRRVRLELSQVILPEVIQAPTTNSARSIAKCELQSHDPAWDTLAER